jgi:NADH-quinone oxidoreductase subunit M
MLWTLQRLFLGTLPERWAKLTDINGREMFTLVPLAVIVIFLGLHPSPMLNLMTASANYLVEVVKTTGAVAMGVVP